MYLMKVKETQKSTDQLETMIRSPFPGLSYLRDYASIIVLGKLRVLIIHAQKDLINNYVTH
ncbi:hypothetical protein A0J61_02872 [Choanephora cucurbitarum]|uniref:Uncharacterized protein n=1 Tax=Choanephora cucurbitarum TaxID=101091 RepID=A0A1C7NJ84_9FUNG|nr:hypothetical protein A0J61_02872 [Choanephora cucurbitarum]